MTSSYSKTILEEMSISPQFAEWSIDLVSEGLSEKIIEIGCGIGRNFIPLKRIAKQIWGTDYNENYLEQIAFEDPSLKNFLFQWDLSTDPAFQVDASSFFCSNVIEHIDDDKLALLNIRKLKNLEKGVFIVPAGKKIYNQLDVSLSHFRRYDLIEFTHLLESTGYKVEKIFSFNKIGVLGWYVQGGLLKKKTLGEANMKLYNFLFPIIKSVDSKIPFNGLSIGAIVKIQR